MSLYDWNLFGRISIQFIVKDTSISCHSLMLRTLINPIFLCDNDYGKSKIGNKHISL